MSENKKDNFKSKDYNFLASIIIFFIICFGCYYFINYVVKEKVYYCDDGDELFDTNTCRKTIYTKGTKQYYCYVSSYNEQLVGDKCEWTLVLPATEHYSCPYGYSGGPMICSRTRYDYYSKKWVYEYANAYITYYSCTSGTLIGSECYNYYSYSAPYNLVCDDGYVPSLINDSCSKIEEYEAYVKYE